MKTLIFSLFLLITLKETFSTYDLTFSSDVSNTTFYMYVISVPFEGFNHTENCNRDYLDYNGTIHRRYDCQSYKDHDITYNISNSSSGAFHLSSCFMEDWNTVGQGSWGFGKYLIRIIPISHPEDSICFYWNSLDSRLGYDNEIPPGVPHGHEYPYHADLHIDYYRNNGTSYVDIHGMVNNNELQHQTVTKNEYYKEISMWNLFYGFNHPLEKNFYAKCTPFPVQPIVIQEKHLRNFIIGTSISFENVLPNTDVNGYNTIENGNYYYYYSNPPIPYGLNDPGNTFCTPGWGYDIDEWGVRITSSNGDNITLRSNKKLWVTGVHELGNLGDTLIFSYGSSLIKETNAQLNSCLSGCLSDSGANSIWSSNASQHAFENSEIGYYGALEHVVNNGGFIKID